MSDATEQLPSPSDSDAEDVLLAHEKLDVYRLAMELDELVVRVGLEAPRGRHWLVDQAERACGSIALNVVEANGRTGADRLHLLKIAKGSALETDTALDLFAHRRLIKPEDRLRAHRLLVRIVQMISGLMRQ